MVGEKITVIFSHIRLPNQTRVCTSNSTKKPKLG
jgi:hypothetical protein